MTMPKLSPRCALAALVMLGLAGCGGGTTDEKAPPRDLYEIPQKSAKARDLNRKSIAFIIDTSGSMNSALGKATKIASAKAALLHILDIYKKHDDEKHDLEAGLFYFDNGTVRNAVPIAPFNHDALAAGVRNMDASGGTPLGLALAYAERSLKTQSTGRKYIVMLTDGENTVGNDPAQVLTAIQAANDKGEDFPTLLYVVAFNVSRSTFAPLEQRGAKVYEAQDGDKLRDVLISNTEMILEKPE